MPSPYVTLHHIGKSKIKGLLYMPGTPMGLYVLYMAQSEVDTSAKALCTTFLLVLSQSVTN